MCWALMRVLNAPGADALAYCYQTHKTIQGNAHDNFYGSFTKYVCASLQIFNNIKQGSPNVSVPGHVITLARVCEPQEKILKRHSSTELTHFSRTNGRYSKQNLLALINVSQIFFTCIYMYPTTLHWRMIMFGDPWCRLLRFIHLHFQTNF